MCNKVFVQLISANLEIQRAAIISLGQQADEMSISALISLIKCHHTDQHSRILAIETVEKVTGKEIAEISGVKCKFVDRFVQRRTAENEA